MGSVDSATTAFVSAIHALIFFLSGLLAFESPWIHYETHRFFLSQMAPISKVAALRGSTR